jgi:CMP-N-acetylneuraminic acid synthetase
MRTLGIVPARAGSTRVSRKNVRLLGGRPLVAWAIDAARGAGRIDHLVVSSDDDEVLAVAAAVDADLPLRRPTELAGPTSPAIDFVRHALDHVEGAGATRFDAVVIVQPTSPFTPAATIDEALALLDESGADSVVTVARVAHDLHPMKFKVLDGDRLEPYLQEEAGRTRADQVPDVFVRNGSVYASARRAVDAGDLLGQDSRAVVMPRELSVDINDELDLAFAEFLLARRT